MEETVFVERRFALAGQEIIARFHLPVPGPTGDYVCRWTILWPGRERRGSGAGIDGVQALTLAMRAAHSELIAGETVASGPVTWLGERDLGLPPPWDGAAPTLGGGAIARREA